MNYSIFHPNTRSTKAHIEKSFKYDENVVSHTTTVLELEFLESRCYISRMLYTFNKDCQALQVNTRHRKNTYGIPTPTCTNMKNDYHSSNQSPLNFWFFVQMTLINAWKGARKNWTNFLKVWPMKVGTNLTWEEVFALEDASFQL